MDRQRETIQEVPKTREELIDRFLSYKDSELTDGERAAVIENIQQSPDAEKYADMILRLSESAGLDTVLSLARGLRRSMLEEALKLAIPVSQHAKSMSWALWDIGKQGYLLMHPEERGPDYRPGNPLTSAEVQQDIIDRGLGLEAYAAQKRGWRGPEGFVRPADAIVLLEPNEQQELNLSDSTKLGKILREAATEMEKRNETARKHAIERHLGTSERRPAAPRPAVDATVIPRGDATTSGPPLAAPAPLRATHEPGPAQGQRWRDWRDQVRDRFDALDQRVAGFAQRRWQGTRDGFSRLPEAGRRWLRAAADMSPGIRNGANRFAGRAADLFRAIPNPFAPRAGIAPIPPPAPGHGAGWRNRLAGLGRGAWQTLRRPFTYLAGAGLLAGALGAIRGVGARGRNQIKRPFNYIANRFTRAARGPVVPPAPAAPVAPRPETVAQRVWWYGPGRYLKRGWNSIPTGFQKFRNYIRPGPGLASWRGAYWRTNDRIRDAIRNNPLSKLEDKLAAKGYESWGLGFVNKPGKKFNFTLGTAGLVLWAASVPFRVSVWGLTKSVLFATYFTKYVLKELPKLVFKKLGNGIKKVGNEFSKGGAYLFGGKK